MNNLKKEEIKVLVILGSENDIITTTRKTNEEGEYIYSGFTWDIFLKIKEALGDKYDFNVNFSKIKHNNYNEYINYVNKKKYDIIIGEFFTDKFSENLINFSTPISIDSNAVIHIRKMNPIIQFISVFKYISKQILLLIIVGIIFGILIYAFDKGREYHSERLKNSSKLRLLRSITTGISTMFGEMGYLSERSSLTIRGIILIVLIMIFSLFYIMYIQGLITNLISKQEDEEINKFDNHKTLIGIKGYSTLNKIKRYGFDIIEFDNINIEDYIKEYLNNTDKYDGAIISYCSAYPYLKKYKNLKISLNFGNEPVAFPINEDKKEFLEDVNKVIVGLRDNLILDKLCKTYYGDIPNTPVCSLT